MNVVHIIRYTLVKKYLGIFIVDYFDIKYYNIFFYYSNLGVDKHFYISWWC